MSASTDAAMPSSVHPPASSVTLMPARFGRYAVLSRLGAGGMGLVYLAQDRELDRHVAIKVVKARGRGASVYQERLLREAKAMAKLAHPNVVTIYDVGVLDDTVFVVMERVEGCTLKEWLGERRRTWSELAPRFVSAARGLAGVHAAGFVHRDFKPSNVLLGEDGSVKVADFGLVVGADERERTGHDVDPFGAGDVAPRDSPTSTGQAVGTRGYISPEQLRGEGVDARSDVFSFCVALYEAVHGALPFAGTSRAEFLAEVQEGIRPRSNTAAPRCVDKLLARGLAADPAARWQTMDELAELLDEPSYRRLGRLVLALVALTAAVAIAYLVVISPAESACPGREEHLAGLWDQERSAAIAAMMRRPSAGIGEEGSSRVVAALERYAADYSDARQQLCLRARDGRISNLELSEAQPCLDERRAALRALLDLLASQGESLASEAVDLVERLPSISACQQSARGQEDRGGEPPRDAQHQELYEELASLGVWLDAGQHETAEATIEELRGPIEAAASPELSARLAAFEGLFLLDRGDGDRGREHLRRSLQTALRHDLNEEAARTAISLMRHSVQGEAGALSAYDGLAEVMIERAGLADSELDLIRRYAFAEALTKIESIRAAWPALREVVEEVRATPTISSSFRLEVYAVAISSALFLEDDDFHDQLVDEALTLTRESRGERHPRVRSLLLSVAERRMRVGDLRQAYEYVDEAVELGRGADDEVLALALWTRGIVHERLGEPDEEIEDFRRAARICGQEGVCAPLVKLEIANSVAVVLDQRGDYEEARALLTEALRGGVGEAPPSLELGFRLTVGDIELHSGNLSAAREIFATLEPQIREKFGEAHWYRQYAERSLALIELAEGDRAGALVRLEALVETSSSAVEPWEAGATRFALAQAIEGGARSRVEHLRAVGEAERGAQIYRELSPGFAAELAEIEAWIAGVRRRTGISTRVKIP